MLDKLSNLLPEIEIVPGERFAWSPGIKRITYPPDISDEEDVWALLHEAGHAIAGHDRYDSDYQLLKMEIEAWETAKPLANTLELNIDEDHIQDCLNSYRDWLYKRSICPNCGTKSLQIDHSNSYGCFNCHASWQVSPSRFCRAYRRVLDEDLQTLL